MYSAVIVVPLSVLAECLLVLVVSPDQSLIPSGGSHPVPDLNTRNLGRSGILHHVVDWNTAKSTNPVADVHEEGREIRSNASLGDPSRHIGVEQIEGGDVHVLAADVVLVGARHVFIEDFEGDLDQSRMSNPGSIVTCLDLSKLVRSDLLHGGIVRLRIVFDGNLSCHSSNGSDLATVAGLDEQSDVSVHEWHGHRYI